MNRLAIGTAQFGSNYGIANRNGKVDTVELGRILECARQHGVDTLDTAIAYGDSEARLGAAGVAGWRVVTKLPPLPPGLADVHGWVRENVLASLRRLRLDGVDAVLLHRSRDLTGSQGEALAKALEQLSADGLASSVGVSIYAPAELDEIWSRWRPQIVQAPFNVLDRRLVASGWLARLVTHGVRVHARSVFLQGLLLLRREERPAWCAPWTGLLDSWQAWCSERDVSPSLAALAHACACQEIERVVTGVDSLPQVQHLLRISDDVPVPPADFACEDVDLIEPSRWGAA